MSSEKRRIILERDFGPVVVERRGDKSYVARFEGRESAAGAQGLSARASSDQLAVSLLFSKATAGQPSGQRRETAFSARGRGEGMTLNP